MGVWLIDGGLGLLGVLAAALIGLPVYAYLRGWEL